MKSFVSSAVVWGLAIIGGGWIIANGVEWGVSSAHATEKITSCPTSYSKGSCALIEANNAMHQNMAISWSGDVDVDFMRSMIPHHQGAVDMANVVLQHGKDPQVRALAQEVIRAQTTEIAQMEAWLAQHPAPQLQPAHAHH